MSEAVFDDGTCLFCEPRVGVAFNPRDQHPSCALRSVLGGIGHLTDHAYWCGERRDPDAGLSYRDSALRVAEWVQVHGVDAAVAIDAPDTHGEPLPGHEFSTGGAPQGPGSPVPATPLADGAPGATDPGAPQFLRMVRSFLIDQGITKCPACFDSGIDCVLCEGMGLVPRPEVMGDEESKRFIADYGLKAWLEGAEPDRPRVFDEAAAERGRQVLHRMVDMHRVVEADRALDDGEEGTYEVGTGEQ